MCVFSSILYLCSIVYLCKYYTEMKQDLTMQDLMCSIYLRFFMLCEKHIKGLCCMYNTCVEHKISMYLFLLKYIMPSKIISSFEYWMSLESHIRILRLIVEVVPD